MEPETTDNVNNVVCEIKNEISEESKKIIELLDKHLDAGKTSDVKTDVKTTDKVEEVAQLNLKKAKCNKCSKDGWVKADGFDIGNKKTRLIIRCIPHPNIICNECLDKEFR